MIKQMNRRSLLKTGGLAALGAMVLGTAACGKNLSIYVQTIIGSLEELVPLLPNQSSNINKAIKIAKDFDTAYRAGKFDNAMALFENLASVIGEVANDVGVSNPSVKIAIAVAGVAMRAIAVLLQSQASQPVVAAAVQSRVSAASARQRSLIESLADDKAVNAVFQAARP